MRPGPGRGGPPASPVRAVRLPARLGRCRGRAMPAGRTAGPVAGAGRGRRRATPGSGPPVGQPGRGGCHAATGRTAAAPGPRSRPPGGPGRGRRWRRPARAAAGPAGRAARGDARTRVTSRTTCAVVRTAAAATRWPDDLLRSPAFGPGEPNCRALPAPCSPRCPDQPGEDHSGCDQGVVVHAPAGGLVAPAGGLVVEPAREVGPVRGWGNDRPGGPETAAPGARPDGP